jgi:hypothetical protein
VPGGSCRKSSGIRGPDGPIRAIISFVLAAAVALLGLKRMAVAGVLLLVLGVVPVGPRAGRRQRDPGTLLESSVMVGVRVRRRLHGSGPGRGTEARN